LRITVKKPLRNLTGPVRDRSNAVPAGRQSAAKVPVTVTVTGVAFREARDSES